jgi:hypothetical protein
VCLSNPRPTLSGQALTAATVPAMRWLGIYVLVFGVLGLVVPAPDSCTRSDDWFYILAAVGLLATTAGGYAISVGRNGNQSWRPYYQASFNLLAGATVLVVIGVLRAGAAGCFT